MRARAYAVCFCARFWACAGTKNESAPACVMWSFVWLTRLVLLAKMGRAYPSRNSQLMLLPATRPVAVWFSHQS